MVGMSSAAGQVSRAMGVCVLLLATIELIQLFWAVDFNASSLHDTQDAATTVHEDGQSLIWEEAAAAPVARLDGAAVQIAHLLYVFAGYATIDEVHAHADVYNLSSDTWESRFTMPAAMAHSHLGIATDGMRFIYIVSGQVGSQCRAPTARNFVLDTLTRTWSPLLPPLPRPRYAPATQLWHGRLHVMGGSEEDRQHPAVEHWSISVRNGQAMESEWKEEISLPRGGPHRACVVVNDNLYVIGGQEGDFKAKSGFPDFRCSRQNEVVYGDVYLLTRGARGWRQLPSPPKPVSHIEFAWVAINQSIIIVGGSTVNHPVTKKMELLADIFCLNTSTQVWKKLGHMPYRGKTVLAAYWQGWLYFTAGQRDKGPSQPAPSMMRDSKAGVAIWFIKLYHNLLGLAQPKSNTKTLIIAHA